MSIESPSISPTIGSPAAAPAVLRSIGVHPIRSEDELDRAIAIVDGLAARAELTPEETDYLIVLGLLIEDYESRTIPEPDVVPGPEMLRDLIAESGLTQAEVSQKTGIPAPSLSEILGGKRGIGPKTRAKLGAYFKVDPSLFA